MKASTQSKTVSSNNIPNQGLIAQAHFVEAAYATEAGGGALKALSDQPFINDWACVSGGAYFEPIIAFLFGVQAGLFGQLVAQPNFGSFDPRSELRRPRYQGKEYIASTTGVRPQ